MNFLAHSLLAHGDPAAVAGQFCGDFVRGSAGLEAFPDGVYRGIIIHRKIDTFTDTHAEVVAARRLFEAPYRRLAGILIDVLFDHFLARDWARYSSTGLADHVAEVHAALAAYRRYLPESLLRFERYLQRERVLVGYRELAGVRTSYERLGRRSPAFAALATGLVPVLQNEAALHAHFERFYPALDAYVRSLDGRYTEQFPTAPTRNTL